MGAYLVQSLQSSQFEQFVQLIQLSQLEQLVQSTQLSQLEQFVQLMLPLASGVRPVEFIVSDLCWKNANIAIEDPTRLNVLHVREEESDFSFDLLLFCWIKVVEKARKWYVGLAACIWNFRLERGHLVRSRCRFIVLIAVCLKDVKEDCEIST